ncbi:omptin family outer membrane protease [Campylobacter majalis]|uniref:omptin family outer membrane protease n=1 Tax=Campylobacter majalis TaxID=2790656 RepID=UPI003D69FE05
MKKISLLGLAFVGLFANPQINQSVTVKPIPNVKTTLSFGLLTGEAKEIVYGDTINDKISQLNWKIKHALILKGDISWDVASWLTLNLNGFTTIKDGKGKMSDYDWLDESDSSILTDQSHHNNTPLNYANEFDINAKTWFFEDFGLKTAALFGFKQSRFSWTSKGGNFIYTHLNENKQGQPANQGQKETLIGKFPDDLVVIGYRQKFSAPYIGLAFEYNYKNFELNTDVKFSNWVISRDQDQHYLRQTTFQERGKNSKFYGISLNAGYYINKNLKLFTEYNYSDYRLAIADLSSFDRTTNETEHSPRGAGLSNKHHTINIGVSYKF